MPTTLQPKILLVTLKYDSKVMQRESSPNEVQKRYPRGTNFFPVQTAQMGYSWQLCSINMTVSSGRPRTIRTKNIIQKINSRLK